MSETTCITVHGMTCEHCTAAVTEELTELEGVTDVAVDLHPGAASPVTITSTAPLDAAVVSAAVAEAGYTATL